MSKPGLRAYDKVKLGPLFAEWEVLEVEREDEWTMARSRRPKHGTMHLRRQGESGGIASD